MDARELPLTHGAEAVRLVRALGQHRYVASRLHLVHAFVFAALDLSPEIAEGVRWAADVLSNSSIDKASKDERLWRRSAEVEIAFALDEFWGQKETRERVHSRLRDHLDAAEIEVPERAPFDETHEDDTFPVLIDAGWELLPLAMLDPERHKGAILSFGEPILFESAKFEESSMAEASAYLQELPALGPVELLSGAEPDGTLGEPLVLWTAGPDAYHEYVLRGALRAAKIAV